MKSWKLQHANLIKIFNNTLASGEIQEIVNSNGEVPGKRYFKHRREEGSTAYSINSYNN
ncbi:hypothetical protein OCHUTO_1045 [Orientia chuto str. Dubai]|uniref:Uncharacterized protein n=1 Tax=Orientia chuto str. Dubai TaxID=1359168 RepID=A0A0F3MGH4_9RICK|nr:hypothetical protein [Candidatus Orientia mediorientalis]KJV54860.1 hypothetical protein OCHUTO_1045 [Orientia chuto str. Dubai]